NGKGFHDFINTYTNEHFTEECGYCDATGVQEKDPLLEEYADCLSFILSIGNEIEHHYGQSPGNFLEYQIVTELKCITDQFLHLFMEISGTIRLDTYIRIWKLFIGLGQMLGFTGQQIQTGT